MRKFRPAISAFISRNGVVVRTVEFGLVAAFAIAAWSTGGDMMLAMPLIGFGAVLGLIVLATAPNLTSSQKQLWSGVLCLFFAAEALFLNWHTHSKETEGAALWALKTIAPYWQLVFGFLLGFLAALSLDHWGNIWGRFRFGLEWSRAATWLLWNTRPGVRRVTYGFSLLLAGETSKHVTTSAPVHTDTVRLEWTPKDKVYLRQAVPGTLLIMRTHHLEREDVRILYEVWGRRHFRATIKQWREMNVIQLHLNFKKMVRDAAQKDPLPAYEP